MTRTLEGALIARGVSSTIRERILRLNPNPVEGEILRGWHRADTAHGQGLLRDVVSRGEFIRRFGREAWGEITAGRGRRAIVHKSGRRQFIGAQAMRDYHP